MGLPLQSFSSIHEMKRDHLPIGRHQHKDLKSTELCLNPIQRRLEAFWGSGQNQNESLQKTDCCSVLSDCC